MKKRNQRNNKIIYNEKKDIKKGFVRWISLNRLGVGEDTKC